MIKIVAALLLIIAGFAIGNRLFNSAYPWIGLSLIFILIISVVIYVYKNEKRD